MPAFVTFGRIVFAVLFIYTGATKRAYVSLDKR